MPTHDTHLEAYEVFSRIWFELDSTDNADGHANRVSYRRGQLTYFDSCTLALVPGRRTIAYTSAERFLFLWTSVQLRGWLLTVNIVNINHVAVDAGTTKSGLRAMPTSTRDTTAMFNDNCKITTHQLRDCFERQCMDTNKDKQLTVNYSFRVSLLK